MDAGYHEFEAACRAQPERYFAECPDTEMHAEAMKALRVLRTSERPLRGNPEGWEAGIIYAVSKNARIPCGVPGLFTADFEKLMGVTMSTVRHRSARVLELWEALRR